MLFSNILNLHYSLRCKTQITLPHGSHLFVCYKRLNAGHSKCESYEAAFVVTRIDA
jgi:hypothetical protein